MNRNRRVLCAVVLVILLAGGMGVRVCRAATLVARATSWRYAKGTQEASDPRTEWRNTDFGDTSWSAGRAPFGYGASGLNTTFGDMKDSYSSFFIRKTFTLTSLEPDLRLRANVDYDDGFIIWINGERVLEDNEPDNTPLYDSLASDYHDPGVYETFELPDPEDYLEVGDNVVAVQAFNNSLGSGDCKIDVELITFKRVADTKFSHDRGFYDASFYLTISTATPGATIRYTTDGTPPSTSYGTVAGTNAVVQITKTTCVRAASFKSGYESTNVDTHTYVFVGQILSQVRPADYPTTWYGTNSSTPADYNMDQAVVTDPAYSGMIQDALKKIPTLSIVAKKTDIFSSYGIYYNGSSGNNSEWEKPASAELLYDRGHFSSDFEGFQIDCGIRPHSHLAVKRSFKLMFSSVYGASKLRYPLFESAAFHADSAAERFDKVVLRAGMNRCVAAFMPEDQRKTTYTRDQWARDTQTAMSGYGSRGTFMHLYINGMYWGLYNAVERPDEAFTSEYFGGEKEDWFAANHGGDITTTPATADDRYDYLINTLSPQASRDMANSANYELMKQYLDLTSFCDYVQLYWYSGGGDWQEIWGQNNFYWGNRNNPAQPGFYIGWDMESSWFDSGPNPMNSPGRSNDGAWVKPQFLTAAEGSTWPFQDSRHKNFARPFRNLMRNADFRALFADRLYKHAKNDGAVTDANAKSRWQALCDMVEDPVVGEYARWGDGKCPYVYTNANNSTTTVFRFGRDKHAWSGTAHDGNGNYNTNWYSARDYVLGLMTGNGDRLLTQCRNQACNGYNLYPSLDPPTFNRHGGAVATGFKLTMSTASSYAIYYTTDGTDPRLPGGGASSTKVQYAGAFTISRTTHVKARLFKTTSTWSAVHAATFNYTAHYDRIRITEIMYNPIGGADFEFVEIKNTGSSTRGLSEMTLRGLRYTFPPGVELASGKTALLVANESVFTNRYPNAKAAADWFGVYAGRLDNGGERLALIDSDGLTVTSVRYNDKAPWPEEADGDGFSLVLADELGDPDDPANWRASNLIGGSPGYDDGAPYRVVINEVLSHTDLPQVDAIELHNAGSTGVNIGGWYLSDNVNAYQKYRIPTGATLPAGGYVVFDEYDFNTNTNDPACFALSSHGDEVYLTQWDSRGNLLYLAEARFGGAQNGVAFGRYVTTEGDTDFVAQSVTNTLGAANAAPKVGPVVINELMYHPAAGSEWEFIELVNFGDSAVALYDPDNTANRWQLSGAVSYTFPAATTLNAREYVLVTATNESAFRARYPAVPAGVRVFGPYTGRLSNGGESVKLWRPDAPDPEGIPLILVDRVQYDDDSLWPENADGDGPSLERQDARAYGNDPANWAASLAAGGTPGTVNSGGLVSMTAGWRYHDRGEDLGTAWRGAAYDDSGWDDGNAPLGYDDGTVYLDIDTTVSYGDNPNDKPITTYFRKTFTLAADPSKVTSLSLKANYDDGFVAYLNGQELVRPAMPGGTILFATAASSHTAAGYETFDLGAHIGKLAQGLNVLAVELHQSGATSSDLFLDLELAHTSTVGTPPAAPDNLTASAASSSRINLAWRDNSNNETGFKLDRRMSGASSWDRVATLGANVSTYADSGLPAGTLFYYKVQAYNADGNSPYSAVASTSTLEGPPAAPANLTATAAGTDRVQLAWSDQSGNETGFRIERRTGGGAWATLTTVGADTISYTDGGLPPATAFTYRVLAYNAQGNSGYSNEDSATTLAVVVQFAAAASGGVESVSPANLTVTLNGPSTVAVRVNFATGGGTATAGADYTAASGTLTFTAGQTSRTISVPITDDSEEESNETFITTLSSPANATLGSRATHTYTITDNDKLFVAYNDLCWVSGERSANITLYTRAENGQLVDYNSGQTIGVTLAVGSGGGGPYTDQGGPPSAGTDAYGVFNGIVDCAGLISYGDNLTLQFTGLDPALQYEFVLFGNRNVSTYTDRLTTVTLSDVASFENASTSGATYSGPSDSSTVICNGWNAPNGYVARYAKIDPGTDGDFLVTLSDSVSKFYANALMLRASRPQVPLPSVGFASAATSGDESVSSVSLSVGLSQAWTNEVRVDYAATGGSAAAGQDYTLAAGTLVFTPGQTSKSIALAVIDDSDEESDETVVVSLSNPVQATIGTGTYTYTIQDNDGPVLLFTAYNDLLWSNGQLNANITLYSAYPGAGLPGSGQLVDYASGANVSVTLSVTTEDTYTDTGYPDQGGDAAAGTEAYAAFNGKVSCAGLMSNGRHTLAFSGMDSTHRYTLVVFGNRANPSYTTRTTDFVIAGAQSFENASTPGTQILASGAGPTNDLTRYCTGWNGANGYVARFTDIRPGAGGTMTVTVGGSSSLYANALMLQGFRIPGSAPRTVKIGRGAVWAYRKGTAEADPLWRALSFDDAGWDSGPAPIGYSSDSTEGPFGTTLDDMRYGYSCIFLRRPFEITNPALVSELVLDADYEDGFIVWLNGEELARVNMTGQPGEAIAFDNETAPLDSIEPTAWQQTLAAAGLPELRPGTNLLAVQVFNYLIGSSDLVFDLALSVAEASPFDTAVDADEDGMPNEWETAMLGGTGQPGDADPDGDGASNLEEFIAGTDPDNGADAFTVDLASAGSGLVVSFAALPAAGAHYTGLSRHYTLDYRTGIDGAGVWTTVPGYGDIAGSGQTVAYTNAISGEKVYWRARVWLQTE
ncbi:MAG: lamin tail domain-containing protein [Kiritimatiellae bacterium]|nr:lamin tail domain-containing protein [Kiritimatiellia bacterium]